MALFDTTAQNIQSIESGLDVLATLRRIYGQSKRLQQLLALYTAGTDTKFNAAINTTFTAAERTEINAMLTTLNTLV